MSRQAIEESVDSFFYQTAFDLWIDRISSWMNRFGFGEPTGIDIYEESNANMPTREWKLSLLSNALVSRWIQSPLVMGKAIGRRLLYN
ncbi:penicillin-binding transpeptidase domain-containing protein [Vibrio lentus]|nr:penicillin-binding transpeptidase domain-containing protein [Vibrio lentus]